MPVTVTAAADDGLFGRYTASCNVSLDYSSSRLQGAEPSDTAAFATMVVLFLACLLIISCMAKHNQVPMDPGALSVAPKSRWVMGDVARIACVYAIITQNCGGEVYGDYNIGFAAQWVLPFLFACTGAAFMTSTSSIWQYLLRCLYLFLAGVAFNAIGDAIANPNAGLDLGNTVYQMWIVVAFFAFALIGWPLRSVLKADSLNDYADTSVDPLPVFFGYGFFFVLFTVLYAIKKPDIASMVAAGSPYSSVATNTFFIASHLFGLYTLVSLHSVLKKANGWLAYVLLAYCFLPRVLFPMRDAWAPDVTMIYALGLVAQGKSFHFSSMMGAFFKSYWPLVIVVLIMLREPTLLGRCDVHPAYGLWERTRWYLIEYVLLLLLLTKTLECSDPLRLVPPLACWGIFAFCTHIMLARVLPVPYAWVVEMLLLPVVGLCFRCYERQVLTGTVKGSSETEGVPWPWTAQQHIIGSRTVDEGPEAPGVFGKGGTNVIWRRKP